MAENFRAPVQCSEDTGDNPGLGSIQTGREVQVPSVLSAGGDLEPDAERVDQSAGQQRHRPPQVSPATGVLMQSGDRIEITGEKSKIVATGIAGAMKPGTIFQLGSENHMTIHQDHRSGSDREGRKANIINRCALTVSQEPPMARHFDVISVGLAGDWRRLGRAFGITDAQLDQIRMDFQYDGQHEINYRVLVKWKQQNPRPTLHFLAQTLLDIGRGDLADELSKG
ncbi:uncharacterized protein [Littorina saxatilis]|uniref:Death domain-containing protein n=1 Tax=Littorina saxatilis TaxID=31220 RepID=A0AAN9GMC7_9CAEN